MGEPTKEDLIALARFIECCDDDEGYDVAPSAMRALKALGYVSGGRGGYYTLTTAGKGAHEEHEAQQARKGEGE